MPSLLKLQALAYRAAATLGKSGRQSAAARHERARFYTAAWREAAEALGATCEPLETDVLLITRGDVSTRVFLNYTPLDDPVSLRIAGNKTLVHRLLNAEGLPTPSFVRFTPTALDDAVAFLREHPLCVVKPASGTGGGQGVTTGITTSRQLRRAAVRAAGYGTDLVIEEQIPGRNFRLLFLDGELLDAVERRPPEVVGDGRSTVRDLVAALNQRRVDAGFALAQSIVSDDLEMRQTLSQQGLTRRSVPAYEQPVQLKSVINDNMADQNESALGILDCSVIESGREAATTIGLRLAGVDVITPDPSSSLQEAGGVILEVNSTPGFHFHYARRDGRTPVAIPVLDRCLEQIDLRSEHLDRRGHSNAQEIVFSN